MKAKQIAIIAVIVLAASSLSALVAYRMAVRRAPPEFIKVGSPSGGQSRVAGGCVDFHDAASRVGQTGCISGRLLRVFNSRGGNSFLDFCENYKERPFTSVIFTSDKSKFGDLGTLEGRQVEIQGSITSYQGHAEIVIHGPEQIRVNP